MEKVYWLVSQLHMSYEDVVNAPYEAIEWLERRRMQELIDQQKDKGNKIG